MAKVVVVDSSPVRVLFEGPKDEAEAFVQKNEPRPHVVDGVEVPQLKVED